LVLGLATALCGSAEAATIGCIFTGTGMGTLGTQSFDGSFSITLIGDTSTAINTGPNFFVNSAVTANFVSGTLSATLPNTSVQVISGLSDPTASNVSFPQSQPSPIDTVNTAVFSTAFNNYDLTTAYALSSGAPSFEATPYLTNDGNLTFSDITALSFEATTPSSVPLPPSLPLFGTALGVMGLLAWSKSRRASPASALA
jgi:hypothetical protein